MGVVLGQDSNKSPVRWVEDCGDGVEVPRCMTIWGEAVSSWDWNRDLQNPKLRVGSSTHTGLW
jgi:hypothetical protein